MSGTYSQEALEAHFEQINQLLAAIEETLAQFSQTLGVPYAQPLADVPPEVVDLARGGDKLGAIKRYRELTGASLGEARDVVVGL